MKNEILSVLRGAIRDTDGIAFAYLFGSFVEEEKFRDIDIGLYLEESSASTRGEILDQLHQRLKGLSAPVDIRILNGAPASFLYHVLQGEALELRNEELHGRILEETVRSYLDLKPLLLRATKEAFGGR